MIAIGQSSTDLNIARKEVISTGLQSLPAVVCMKNKVFQQNPGELH